MIISYNVCDQCGDKIEIKKDSFNGLEIDCDIRKVQNRLSISFSKIFKDTATFCCKTCMIEYLKINIGEDGTHKTKGEDLK